MVVRATTCALVRALICVLLRFVICAADKSLIFVPRAMSWSVDNAAISLLEMPEMSEDVQLEATLVGVNKTPWKLSKASD